MREYVLLLAALALGAGAAESLQENEDGPEATHSRQPREVQGLFPFPRVGRASWPSRDSGLGENKRQGLIPFPRVGRSENADPRNMPVMPWFVVPEFYPGKRVPSAWMPNSSPRLGRESKRFDTERAEYQAMNRLQRGRESASFTPRLGRELEADDEALNHDGAVAGLSPEDVQVGVRGL